MQRLLETWEQRLIEAIKLDVSEYCLESGMTQEDVSDVIGLEYTTFNNYLNGHRRVPIALPLLLARKLDKLRAVTVFAEIAGGRFVPGWAVKDATPGDVLKSLGEMSREMGAATEALLSDLADGRLDDYAQDRKRLEDVAHAAWRAVGRHREDRMMDNGFNPEDGINDDMCTHTPPVGAAALDTPAAAPVGTRIFPPNGQSPDGGRGDSPPSDAAPEQFRDAAAPSASQSVAQDALEPQAATQAATVQDGADLPFAAPSTPQIATAYRVVARMLDDDIDRCNTMEQRFNPVERDALGTILAAVGR